MPNKFSVLIIGCKKHEQIAKRSFDLIDIFWKDIKDKTIFCTDILDEYQNNFSSGRIVEEASGSYCERIKKGLEIINSEYVVLLLDDYFLTKPVKCDEFERTIEQIKTSNTLYCKLIGLPISLKKFKAVKGGHQIKKFTHYGVSLQPSIWKKEALVEALSYCEGSTAWEVETGFQKYQHANFEKCITFNANYLKIKNAALRGQITPGVNKLLRKNDIESLDMKKVCWIKYKLFMLRQHVAMHLPRFIRRIGKKIGSLFGKKYYSES